ncbi:hypothetical protein M9H77_27949 [Catharanthus roseus]|uniref:Uncharacterized protein n=1 Tax=Catharanthus roseus TaxID=4058 RepID=A0ACC0AEK5_CATRO|nr:hypothetical protein M9H77_27949 [Catharanthus roseus]
MVLNYVIKLNVLKIIARANTGALSPSQTVSQMPMLASYSVVTSYVVDPSRGSVNGKVIAVDAFLPLNPDNSPSTEHTTQVDLFTLASYHSGGKERTEHEFLALAIEAGFKEIRKACVCYDSWLMEFYKRN